MLRKCPDLKYIPVLHSNTSSIESQFILMRFMKADTSNKYELLVNVEDNQSEMKKMKENPMYDPHEERYTKHQPLTVTKQKERKSMVESCEAINASECFINIFQQRINDVTFTKYGDLWTKLKNKKVYSSYKMHLLNYTDLFLYCEAGIYTTHEKYILYFLRSTCKNEEIIINTVCQHLMTDVLLCLLTCLNKSDENLNSYFWYNIMQFISFSLSQSLINFLPEGMRSKTLLSSIFFSLIKHFEMVMNECTSKENNIE